jgi:EmrB/QacA subfamily drug resistance transporter
MSVGESNSARHARLVFLVVAAAIFMSNLDLFIVNVALPSIGTDFGGSLAQLSWVLNAYAIGFAALLIAAGRLGDRIGQRRVFLVGVAVFTLASALCAAAPNLEVLVGARVLQAAGAAALIPTSLALLLAGTPVEKRAGAVRAWSAIGGVSAALGPVVGGVLVEADWRWVFLVNLPVGLAALVVGRRVLPHPAGSDREPLPDLLGALLLTAGIGALTGALVEAPSWGWTSPRTIGLFAAAVVALGWFVSRCVSHERPLVELTLFRIPRYGAATAALFLFSLGFAGMLLSNVLWCQEVWNYSAIRTGLALAPGPAMVPFIAMRAGGLIQRFGAGAVAAAGNVLFAGGLIWRVALAGPRPEYATEMLPSMLLTGIGVGLALPTLIATASTVLPQARFGTGSAIVNTSRQVASALGVAILITILGTPATAAAARAGFQHGWIAAAVANGASALVCLWLGVTGRKPAAQPARASAGEPRPAAAVPVGSSSGSGGATAPSASATGV